MVPPQHLLQQKPNWIGLHGEKSQSGQRAESQCQTSIKDFYSSREGFLRTKEKEVFHWRAGTRSATKPEERFKKTTSNRQSIRFIRYTPGCHNNGGNSSAHNWINDERNYEKPLLNWDPNGIKKVITAGMLKSPPTGLAMPQALYCIVDYINGNNPQLRENSNNFVISNRLKVMNKRIEWWKTIFGQGNIRLVVPRDARGPSNPTPNPLYHMLKGLVIYWARWELLFPWLVLPCWKEGCTGVMVRSRNMDLSKPSC